MNSDGIQRLIRSLDNQQELMHYSSQYYDPEKAHEYYMQNRQLKGRTTSGLSEDGKEVWNATKANISSEKKNRIKEYKDQEQIDIQNARSKADATRESITNKLKALSDALNAKYKTNTEVLSKAQKEQIEAIARERQQELEQIQDTKTRKIKKINEDDSLSPEERQSKKEGISKNTRSDVQDIKEEFSKKAEEVREDTSTQREKLSLDKKGESTKNSEAAKTERKQVAAELKGTIKVARDTYSANKKSLDDTYENLYQEEYDNIKSQYSAPVKGRKKK